MDIGVGLPNSVPGVHATTVTEWAKEAERLGFAALATIDRLAYPNFESLTSLTAAAVLTERIRLTTAILISPLHANTALLAKQTATLDRLCGGRLVLGLAVGSRPDDYTAGGVEMRGRGATLESQLTELERIWSATEHTGAPAVGPSPAQRGGPATILGGHSAVALERAARRAHGWIAGAAGPRAFGKGAATVRKSWQAAGRGGRPRLLALAYFALGPDAPAAAEAYLRDYYASAGPFAEQVIASAATSETEVRALVDAYAEHGCDELILMPCTDRPDQIQDLAEAVAPVGSSL